jgi:phosphoenolpyruvate carboxykinase (ATP)
MDLSTTEREDRRLSMANSSPLAPDLTVHGIYPSKAVHARLSPAALLEFALARREGQLTDRGALVALTGKHTGRAPQDRYLIQEPSSEKEVDWGKVNRPMSPAVFDQLLSRVQQYLRDRDLFVCDASACADPRYRLPVRVIADKAWHALFAQCLFREIEGLEEWDPASGMTVLCASGMQADPARDGTRTDTFIVLHLHRRLVLIGGTEYAGEIKKSIFSALNYLLPQQGVFPMHCSATIGKEGDAALFFGLSGTGKTTLSADPQRRLIGDDEHGWSDAGVFNIEGGCYAKCIRLSHQGERQIWDALRFGSVLENVAVDPISRRADFDDDRITENTRAAYPLNFIDGAESSGRGGNPQTVLFLTCDAFGVLPPLSKLTHEQALYHFLSGYTAKVAGTEAGVTAPEATFSTCFAAPFLPLRPTRYAELLADRLRQHQCEVWLVNTGWIGGPQGQGRRVPLAYTRSMVQAVLDRSLRHVPLQPDPRFGVFVPESCPHVPQDILQPRHAWPDSAAYDVQAKMLAGRFRANFESYAPDVTEAVRRAGPS